MEKYEGYMKALNVDLKAFRERYQESVEEQRCQHIVRVKRCLRGTHTKATIYSEMNYPNTRATVVRPLLPAPVITDPVPEMSLLPSHEDLFIATTPVNRGVFVLKY